MIGILITARVGSGRLPEKHFIEANGKPFIEWLLLRLRHVFLSEVNNEEVKLIIASSDKPENKKFETEVKKSMVEIFYGDDDNIPLRHLQCARQYGFTHIISVDGDDILCSARAAFEVYKYLKENSDTDICSSEGLPLGMNVSGYRVDYLEKCLAGKEGKKIETGWGRIFLNPREKKIKMGNYDLHSSLRFTLDYPDDAKFFSKIIHEQKENIVSIGDEELINFVKFHKYFEINSHLSDEYWKNFNDSKELEQKNEKQGLRS